jgi:hypothetical protein
MSFPKFRIRIVWNIMAMIKTRKILTLEIAIRKYTKKLINIIKKVKRVYKGTKDST